MGDEHQVMRQMEIDQRVAVKKIKIQGFSIGILGFIFGVLTLRNDSYLLAVPSFMGSGFVLAICYARIVLLRTAYVGRVWAANVHGFYCECVRRLYTAYGHNAADVAAAVSKVPPIPDSMK